MLQLLFFSERRLGFGTRGREGIPGREEEEAGLPRESPGDRRTARRGGDQNVDLGGEHAHCERHERRHPAGEGSLPAAGVEAPALIPGANAPSGGERQPDGLQQSLRAP